MAKSAKLQEVEDDAVRITEKRFRDQEEERLYQKSKLETEAPAPVVEETPEVESEVVESKKGSKK
jgi:hypothetical protein